MTVAIVDYGSGNLHSAAKAFERAANETGVTVDIVVTSDPDVVRRADRIVLPGVGAFADCRRGLDAVAGMVEALDERVRSRGRPFLGICVGMQLRSVGVAPKLLCVVTAERIHFERVPVFLLPPDEGSALDE